MEKREISAEAFEFGQGMLSSWILDVLDDPYGVFGRTPDAQDFARLRRLAAEFGVDVAAYVRDMGSAYEQKRWAQLERDAEAERQAQLLRGSPEEVEAIKFIEAAADWPDP